jgi:hypothetical protein
MPVNTMTNLKKYKVSIELNNSWVKSLNDPVTNMVTKYYFCDKSPVSDYEVNVLYRLAAELELEDNEVIFDEGKNKLLSILDVFIHKYHNLDYHYHETVKTVLNRPSLYDIELNKRLGKADAYLSELGARMDVKGVLSAKPRYDDLINIWKNRMYGHIGIYNTFIFEETEE